MSDKIFVTYKIFVISVGRKILFIFKIWNHFLNLKLAQKRLNSYISLEIHPFFTIRITTTTTTKHVLLFNNYVQLDLTVFNQQWLSFYFRPDHFTIVFLDILIIEIVNLRWLSLFLWFHRFTILILLYFYLDYFFVLNFYFIVAFSFKVPRVMLSKKVLDFLVC